MKLDKLHMRRYCDYNDFSLKGKGSMKNIVMFNQYVKKGLTFGVSLPQHFSYTYL
jgi:hypothetical protein